MKYFFLFLGVLSLSLVSCKKDQAKDPRQLADDSVILQLNDSITHIAAAFHQSKDSASLQHALALSDKVLSLDRTEEGQYYGTLRKVQLLSLLGRKKEAFLLQDRITDIDPNSIERLIYNGVSARLNAQIDSAEASFTRALEQCDKRLILQPSNAELSISAATVYIYQGKKEEAEKAIDKALAVSPENEVLISFKASLDKAYDKAREFLDGEE